METILRQNSNRQQTLADLALLTLLVVCIPLTACTAQNVAYVSSSEGNDNNDGFTIRSPYQSLSKAIAKADTIYLKAGDVFYGNVDFRGKVVDRYGRGDNPIISGFRYIKRPEWEKVDENLWRLDLTKDIFEGVDCSMNNQVNNVGCIYDCEADVVYGCKRQFEEELTQDWDFWQTDIFIKEDVNDSTFSSLVLYLTKDPNAMSLALSTGTTGVKANNCHISNLRITGFGIHGIVAGSRAVIKNCTIDIIGGSIQIGYKKFTSLGNGIEFGVSKNISDSSVTGCTISRCYDCGVTIQGSGYQQAAPSNITISGNYIHNCCQGWEDFLRNGETDLFENCVFSDNLLVDNGSKIAFGYGDGRFKYCQVLGNNTQGIRDMILRNNVFINGNYYCSGSYRNEYKSHVWEGNVCYIQRGQFLLSNYTGSKDVIRIPAEKGEFNSIEEATEDAIKRYRRLTGDETSEFVIIEEKDKVVLINQFLKKLRIR